MRPTTPSATPTATHQHPCAQHPSDQRAPRLLVVEHEATCPPAYVGQWLRAEGVELALCRPYRGDAVPVDLRHHDGLLVLGGSLGAGDDADHPWLTPTKQLIASAVAADSPVWGICLGHQLMTVALGGTVQVNPRGPASGLTPVGWGPDAVHDPLCAGVPRDALAVHWNNDIAETLPGDARLLATGPDGSAQVVRFGERAWGVQFHPEVGGDVVAVWAASARERDPAASSVGSVDSALDAIRAHESQLRQTWQPMAKAFAAQLG